MSFLAFCFVSFSIVKASLETTAFLAIEEIVINNADDIIPVDDSLVVPVVYPNIQGMDTLSGDELKQRFVDVILPGVLIAKYRIDSARSFVFNLKQKELWEPADSLRFGELSEKYNAGDIDELLVKLVTHPNSIVLAQAAMESGWGTSRFFEEANNLFGIWSFDPDEPRMRAAYKRGSKAVYVRKYEDVSQSIEDYFVVLARAKAYENFRKSRVNDTDPYEMVNHLVRYSEKRWKYVSLVKLLMRKNEFTKYDSYTLDPEYVVNKKSIKWLN